MQIKINIIILMIGFFLETASSQVVFEDEFKGEAIKPSWQIVKTEGEIDQINELILSNDGKSSGWDKNYLITNTDFSRAKEGKVLRLTIQMKSTSYSDFMVGVVSHNYKSCDDANNGFKYGFHADRLDRTLWFMEDSSLTNLLRMVPAAKEYQTYKLSLELGANGGALWRYDIGDGYKTARDTRINDGNGIEEKYKVIISSYFYAKGKVAADDIKIEYVNTSSKKRIDLQKWPEPVNAEFNGRMDKLWTNWAGDLGVVTPLSVPDFESQKGWLVLCGPKDGFGMYLRHYPFMPKKSHPFYAIVHMRYPQIHKPDKNFKIIMCLLADMDSNLYTDDVAYLCFSLENTAGKKITKIQSYEMNNILKKCAFPEVVIDKYWESGDLFLLMGFEDKTRLKCAYKFNKDQNWKRAFDYDVSNDGFLSPLPIGFDLIGPCRNSGWISQDYCDASEISYEIDYVHFEDKY